MKLEKALALEIDKEITAAEADQKYSNGELTSKFMFECPDDKCDAPVTCANLNKPKKDRRRDPYYKVVGIHSEDCDIGKDIKNNKRVSKRSTDDLYGEDEYVDGAIRLNLNPPGEKRPEAVGTNLDESEGRGGRQGHGEDYASGKRKIQRTKTLSSLVYSFLDKEDLVVQLPQLGTIRLNELFVKIDGQDVASFDDEFRIYYGKAWINIIKDKEDKQIGYTVVFANELTFGDLVKRPSIFIPLDKIETTSFRNFKKKKFDKLADKYPKDVFVVSETGPYVRNQFINIWLEGVEYLDYRLD